MASKLILDRTYTYGGRHFGPGQVTFGDDETEAYEAVAKRHMALTKEEQARNEPPPSPVMTENQLYRLESEQDKQNHPANTLPNADLNLPADQVPDGGAPSEPLADGTAPPDGAASPNENAQIAGDGEGIPDATQEQSEMLGKSAKELIAMAQEKGITVQPSMTKTQLVELITSQG